MILRYRAKCLGFEISMHALLDGQDQKAAQFFRGSEAVSKVTTERPRAAARLSRAGSLHFAPHVWATRHIRRYRQSEDEDEDEGH